MRMKKTMLILVASLATASATACDNGSPPQPTAAAATAPAEPKAAPAPTPEFKVPTDPKNIVNIAIGSKDHTTLVAALKAADYVDGVSNAGPLTVFAPTNAAFDKLPKGTVEGLLKPEKVEELRNVLKFHVVPSTYEAKDLKDGMTLGMVNGGKVTVHVKDAKITVNDATIVASIRASNGVVHVIDGVLLPPSPTAAK
jgi:uncharacterized surface protein with fasciclin (FAS1) repeats